MARVRSEKEFNLKKKQIVNYAIELLIEVGYENFSINKVINNAKTTKGAFFHYFLSKEELIEEILNIILDPMINEFYNIANKSNVNPKEKILELFAIGYKMKGIESKLTQQLIKFLHKKENKIIFQEIIDRIITRCLPIYEQVFIEGKNSKEFSIKYPHGEAFIFLNTILSINKEIGKISMEKCTNKKSKENLNNKILAFELYAKKMFNFNSDVNLYNKIFLSLNNSLN
ncbi:MAG: TetR/AcrR family transcriptional regulator [Clostridiales bacterium]